MGRIRLIPGEEYDIASGQDLKDHLRQMDAMFEEQNRVHLRGIKPIRVRSELTGVAANASFTVALNVAPMEGYIWALTRVYFLLTSSLTTSAFAYRLPANPQDNAPLDVLQIVDTYTSSIVQKYNKQQLHLHANEYLTVQGTNIAAPGQVIITAEGVSVPAEMVGKLW